jgi:thiamine pyrophosphate-dependent acetolactate synthase large subunit-like protein
VTGGDMVVRTLAEQQVTTVFGIPGALNAHLYDAMARLQPMVRHVLARHELGAAWMADGYARAGGDVGVVVTVPGPGTSHAASAIGGAYTDCSRVLLISSRSESHWRGEFRRDLFHGLDQQRLFAGITKWQAVAHTPHEIAPILAEAFLRLRSGRPGPVHVEIPADVLGEEAGTEVPAYASPPRTAAEPALVAQAGAAIGKAARPLILAGDGVLHAGGSDALGALADAAGAPVITTVLGKGALPDAHAWSLGDMNSPAGQAAYQVADLVVAVGVRFVQVDTRWPWFRPPRRLVHIDADRRELGRVFAPEYGLCADPRTALEQLVRAIPLRQGPDGWSDRLAALKRQHEEREVLPLLAALRRALPPEGLVSFDVCYPGYRSRSEWTSHRPNGYYYPGVYVGMGFGLPVGIGARVARPECPVLVVAGDAGFQMTMSELGTAVQDGVAVVIVVVNDGGLTLIRNVQDRLFAGRRYAVDMENPDFCALAAAYGIAARRAGDSDELEAAASEAFGSQRLTLIEYVEPCGSDVHRRRN